MLATLLECEASCKIRYGHDQATPGTTLQSGKTRQAAGGGGGQAGCWMRRSFKTGVVLLLIRCNGFIGCNGSLVVERRRRTM